MHKQPNGGAPLSGGSWPLFASNPLAAWDRGEKVAMNADVLEKLASVYTPYFDIKETKENYLFVADLPGLREDDVDVEVADDCLTIAGEREKDVFREGDYYYALDRHFGAFCLTFPLPRGIRKDAIKAKMELGVLTVKVPKGPAPAREN